MKEQYFTGSPSTYKNNRIYSSQLRKSGIQLTEKTKNHISLSRNTYSSARKPSSQIQTKSMENNFPEYISSLIKLKDVPHYVQM